MSTVVLMKKELMLNGLTCAHCASVIDEKVKHIDGVKNSNLNFTNKKLSVEIDCDNEEKIIKNIIDIINDTMLAIKKMYCYNNIKRIRVYRY